MKQNRILLTKSTSTTSPSKPGAGPSTENGRINPGGLLIIRPKVGLLKKFNLPGFIHLLFKPNTRIGFNFYFFLRCSARYRAIAAASVFWRWMKFLATSCKRIAGSLCLFSGAFIICSISSVSINPITSS